VLGWGAQKPTLSFAGETSKYPKTFALNCSYLVTAIDHLRLFSSEIIKTMRRLRFQWSCCATKYSAKGEDTKSKGHAATVVPSLPAEEMLYKLPYRPLF